MRFEMNVSPAIVPGDDGEERKLRNRVIFLLTGRWPTVVVEERLRRYRRLSAPRPGYTVATTRRGRPPWISVGFATHQQAMACVTCGLAGEVPEHAFPQAAGLWDRPCPECGEQTVWVTQIQERPEDGGDPA